MIEKWPITLPALTGRKKRNVYVYLPEEARENENARFPVLYMFDGHNVFFDEDATYGKSWGMGAYMDETKTPMIIVAVECNHGKNNARLKEYSPFSFTRKSTGRIVGRGEKYMDWLIHELKPMIDENYPTLPDRAHTLIAGSSMGGLMSLYAVLAHNDVFSRAACLSPSVWTNPKKMKELIRTASLTRDTRIYLDYGSREMKNHDQMLTCFSSIIKELMERKLMISCRIVPNGDHCEACWEEQIPFFMNALLYQRD